MLKDYTKLCPVCSSNSRELVTKHWSSLASNICLKCPDCELQIKGYRNKVSYLQKKLNSLKGIEDEKIEYRKTYQALHFARCTLNKSIHLSKSKITASDNITMLRELGKDPLVIKETRIDVLYGLSNLMDEAYKKAELLKIKSLVLYGEKEKEENKLMTWIMSPPLPLGTILKLVKLQCKPKFNKILPLCWHILIMVNAKSI